MLYEVPRPHTSLALSLTLRPFLTITMVVPFSVSFGDLVALSDLVRKLALNNSRGATHDFHSFLASLTSLRSGNRLLDIRRKISWDQNGHKTKPPLEDLDAHVRALQIFTDMIVLCVAPHFLPLLY